MNGHHDTVTEGIIRFRDLLLAHQAMGRDLEDIIRYLDRTIAKRQKEAAT